MRLTEFFTGVAAKRLRPVEVNPKTSNQHEIDGINKFRKILGNANHKFRAVYLYLDDV